MAKKNDQICKEECKNSDAIVLYNIVFKSIIENVIYVCQKQLIDLVRVKNECHRNSHWYLK